MLMNPRSYLPVQDLPETRRMMQKVIDFFEAKGKRRLKEDDRNRVWYSDFLDMSRRERLFATLLTPSGYGAADSRWDTSRIVDMNEVVERKFTGDYYQAEKALQTKRSR